MINLSLKMDVHSVASGESPEATDDGYWRDIGDMSRSSAPFKMRYVCRLLERSYSLGVKIESFYVTDTEKGKPQHRRIKLSAEMIHALAMHGADFSYGVFSPFPRSSRYSVDGYYILRFRQEYKEIFHRFVNEKMRELDFNAFSCQFEHIPYVIFDAGEDGLEYLLREVAGRLKKPRRNMLLHIDYFTNGSWCWPGLEAETIQAVDRMRGSISMEVHPNMGKLTGDGLVPLWKHVFRMARKHLKMRRD